MEVSTHSPPFTAAMELPLPARACVCVCVGACVVVTVLGDLMGGGQHGFFG